MVLTVGYTLKLIEGARPSRFQWPEEFLASDDDVGHTEVRRANQLLIAGKYEWTRWGFPPADRRPCNDACSVVCQAGEHLTRVIDVVDT